MKMGIMSYVNQGLFNSIWSQPISVPKAQPQLNVKIEKSCLCFPISPPLQTSKTHLFSSVLLSLSPSILCLKITSPFSSILCQSQRKAIRLSFA